MLSKLTLASRSSMWSSWARSAGRARGADDPEGKVPRLADLNAGSTRFDTISLSYFQSSLVVGLIVEKYGDEALNTMLQAYGEGLDTNLALRKGTGTDLPALQVALDAAPTYERAQALLLRIIEKETSAS